MSVNITNTLTLTKCPICSASYSINIPLDEEFNKLCFQCCKCHICFCALCRAFPFHADQKCPQNDVNKSDKSTENIQANQNSSCLCEKLDLNKLNYTNGLISHPSIDKSILKDLVSISTDFCKANLIQLNEQNDLKKQIFDVMNVYLCKNHRNSHLFIFGHKCDKDIDIKDTCPICNCGQIPICPEHKYRYMTYKCCKCCSTATHIDLNGRKICFLCERCFQMSFLNEKNSIDSHDEKKCRFYPYQNLSSEIVGRCDKCDRLFVI